MSEIVTCPRCGTPAPLEIIYGLPASELFERADRGEVVLGGCSIFDGKTPAWRCRNAECAHEWGDIRQLERVSVTE